MTPPESSPLMIPHHRPRTLMHAPKQGWHQGMLGEMISPSSRPGTVAHHLVTSRHAHSRHREMVKTMIWNRCRFRSRYRNRTRITSKPAQLRHRNENPGNHHRNLPLPAPTSHNTLKISRNLSIGRRILASVAQKCHTFPTRMLPQRSRIVQEIVPVTVTHDCHTNRLRGDFGCEGRSISFGCVFRSIFERLWGAQM